MSSHWLSAAATLLAACESWVLRMVCCPTSAASTLARIEPPTTWPVAQPAATRRNATPAAKRV